MNNSLLWFFLIFFFLFFEMGHPGLLYFVAFSCGSLCSLILTTQGFDLQFQFVSFLVSTFFALAMIHVFVKQKKYELATPFHRSNAEALVGKKVIVFRSEFDKNIWQTKIAGQVWLVRAVHDQILEDGLPAIIVDIQGCHLRVDVIRS